MSEWVEAALGDVMALDVNAVEVDPVQAYDIVGVLNRGRGLLYREPMAGSETAYKTLNRIGPNQVVYSRLKAFEGAITVAPADLHEVYASQEFPTFTCGSSLLPDYFRLLTTTKRLWDTLQNLSTGMGGRRERVKPKDFLTIKIALPSLPEQRRIVDILSAVDAQIEALAAETRALVSTYIAFLKDISESHKTMPIESVVERAFAGGTPSRDRVDFYGGNIPWLKSGEVENDHIETSGEFITEAGLKGSSAKMVPTGATVVAMYGQGDTKGKAGYVAAPVTTNQAVLALIPDERVVTPRYLLHAVRSQTDALRARAIGAAQPNLSKGLVLAHEIPVPETLDEQRTITDAADALSAENARLTDELVDLRSFRSTLLTALLNREIEIPEAYDDLLEKVS